MATEPMTGLLAPEIITTCTPESREPGQWLTRHLITSNKMFSKLWPRIHKEMGEFKFVGLDVECVNFKNLLTFARFYERQGKIIIFVTY